MNERSSKTGRRKQRGVAVVMKHTRFWRISQECPRRQRGQDLAMKWSLMSSWELFLTKSRLMWIEKLLRGELRHGSRLFFVRSLPGNRAQGADFQVIFKWQVFCTCLNAEEEQNKEQVSLQRGRKWGTLSEEIRKSWEAFWWPLFSLWNRGQIYLLKYFSIGLGIWYWFKRYLFYLVIGGSLRDLE